MVTRDPLFAILLVAVLWLVIHMVYEGATWRH